MKKTLMAMILSGAIALGSSAMAGPLELNKQLTDRVAATHYCTNYFCADRKEFEQKTKIDGKYRISVNANSFSNETSHDKRVHGESKFLSFEIQDEDTDVYIEDKGSDGLSEGDSLYLNHRFKNDDTLSLTLDYYGNDNYSINGEISFKDKSEPVDMSAETSGLNSIMKNLALRKINPVVNWGLRVYDNIVDSASRDSAPNLPYKDLKGALKKVEKILPLLKSREKSGEYALRKLADGYVDLARK